MLIYHKLLEVYLQTVFSTSVWRRKLWTIVKTIFFGREVFLTERNHNSEKIFYKLRILQMLTFPLPGKYVKSHHLKTTNRNAWVLKLVWLWFVIGSKVTCNFINQSEVKSKPIVNLLSPVYFPALDGGYMYLFLYLIGSFDCLPVQWLAVM